jgi:hypothetical protein
MVAFYTWLLLVLVALESPLDPWPIGWSRIRAAVLGRLCRRELCTRPVAAAYRLVSPAFSAAAIPTGRRERSDLVLRCRAGRVAAEALEKVMRTANPYTVRGRVRLGGRRKPRCVQDETRVRKAEASSRPLAGRDAGLTDCGEKPSPPARVVLSADPRDHHLRLGERRLCLWCLRGVAGGPGCPPTRTERRPDAAGAYG